MSLFDAQDDLVLTRKTFVRLPTIKFVDLRDGMQAGDCAVNNVSAALELLMIQVAFAHAYRGQTQFEIWFAGSSTLGVAISETAAAYLGKMHMAERANLFARTMHYKSASPESDKALVAAVEEAKKVGMTNMTFVSKATPRQTCGSFHLDDPFLHIMQVGESFRYAGEQGIIDLTLDPEHAFEALRWSQADREFFMLMCVTAYEGGCRRIVLCDTNGDTTPEEITHALQWLHTIGDRMTDAAFRVRWQTMMREMQWGLHLHDDHTYTLASTMQSLDSNSVDHLDMTLIQSGERGGGNNQFFKWACQMFQERGVNVFGENTEIWQYIVPCAYRIAHIMHRQYLSPREHRLGRLTAAQTAGMHTVVQGRNGTLYRPDAYLSEKSVLDLLDQTEVFSLNRQAGKENIMSNMRAMGFREQAQDIDKVKLCAETITSDLEGENGDICYSLHKASATLRFWQALYPLESIADFLNIHESRVSAGVRDDGDAHARARITFDDEASETREWTESSSDQGILDAQFRALLAGLKSKKPDIYDMIESVEIVDYHQDALGIGSDARVVTSMTLIDRVSRDTWAVSCVRESSFNSAYECMKDGLRYWIGVREGKFIHYQDPGLSHMYRYTPEVLLRRLYESVNLDPNIALDFLAGLQKSA